MKTVLIFLTGIAVALTAPAFAGVEIECKPVSKPKLNCIPLYNRLRVECRIA